MIVADLTDQFAHLKSNRTQNLQCECGIPHDIKYCRIAGADKSAQYAWNCFPFITILGGARGGSGISLPPSMPPSPHKHHNVNFVSATMFSGAAPAMATHFIRDNSFERLLNWTFSWLFHVITTVFASFESSHKITIAEGWVDVAGVPACSHSHSCLIDKNVCPDNWYLEPIVFPMFPPPPCLHPSTGLEL